MLGRATPYKCSVEQLHTNVRPSISRRPTLFKCSARLSNSIQMPDQFTRRAGLVEHLHSNVRPSISLA